MSLPMKYYQIGSLLKVNYQDYCIAYFLTLIAEVDFSVIDPGELARNYTNRGGKAEVKSDERKVQEQREMSTLMVIYTTPSDIPPSPREPSEPFTGDTLMEESFGAPNEQTKVRRL